MKNLVFECRICGERFGESPGFGTLSSHYKMHHPDPPTGTDQEQFERHREQWRYIIQKVMEKNAKNVSAESTSIGGDSATEIHRRMVACLVNSQTIPNFQNLVSPTSNLLPEIKNSSKPSTMLQCKKCGVKLSSFFAVQEHYRSHKSDDTTQISPEKQKNDDPITRSLVPDCTPAQKPSEAETRRDDITMAQDALSDPPSVQAGASFCEQYSNGLDTFHGVACQKVTVFEELPNQEMADLSVNEQDTATDEFFPFSQQSSDDLNDSFALQIDEEVEANLSRNEEPIPDKESLSAIPDQTKVPVSNSEIIVISDCEDDEDNGSETSHQLVAPIPLAYTFDEMMIAAANARSLSSRGIISNNDKPETSLSSDRKSSFLETTLGVESSSAGVEKEDDGSSKLRAIDELHFGRNIFESTLSSQPAIQAQNSMTMVTSPFKEDQIADTCADSPSFRPLAYSLSELIGAPDTGKSENVALKNSLTNEDTIKIVSVASLSTCDAMGHKERSTVVAMETQTLPEAIFGCDDMTSLQGNSDGIDSEHVRDDGDTIMDAEMTDTAPESILATKMGFRSPSQQMEDMCSKLSSKAGKCIIKKSTENPQKSSKSGAKSKRGRKKKPVQRTRLLESSSDDSEIEHYSKEVFSTVKSLGDSSDRLQDVWYGLDWNSTKDATITNPQPSSYGTSDLPSTIVGNTDLSDSSTDHTLSPHTEKFPIPRITKIGSLIEEVACAKMPKSSGESACGKADIEKMLHHIPVGTSNRPNKVTHRKISKEVLPQIAYNETVDQTEIVIQRKVSKESHSGSSPKDQDIEVRNKPHKTHKTAHRKKSKESAQKERSLGTKNHPAKAVHKNMDSFHFESASNGSSSSPPSNHPPKAAHKKIQKAKSSDIPHSEIPRRTLSESEYRTGKAVRRKTSRETETHGTGEKDPNTETGGRPPAQRSLSRESLSHKSASRSSSKDKSTTVPGQHTPIHRRRSKESAPSQRDAEPAFKSGSSESSPCTDEHKRSPTPAEIFIPVKKRATARKSIRSSSSVQTARSSDPKPMQNCVRCGELIYFDQENWIAHWENECTGKKQ